MDKPKIIDINGPVVKACGMSMYKVRDMVVVGEKKKQSFCYLLY